MDFHSLSVLEYDKIKDLLREKAGSNLGREACSEISPFHDPERIERSLAEICELKILLPSIEPFLQQITDSRHLLGKLQIPDALLEPKEINLILKVLQVSRNIRSLVKTKDYPALSQITSAIVPCPKVEASISKAISPDDEVLDSASPKLRKLRKEVEMCKGDLKDALNRILRIHKDDIQENMITIRDSRYVINVKSSKQRKVGGVVHGASASGLSVFLEPFQVVDLNNALVERREEEMKEINRILTSIARLIRENLQAINATIDALKKLDFTYAKARFSIDYDCVAPELNRRGYVRIEKGRHPLLTDPVPLTVEIGDEWTTILLSGPNTGGKTVALKTVGLLTLMTQSGMEIPSAEGTTIPLFGNVFADIGDQQSIEENLSTFSSHMSQVVKILEESNDESLVLLDELGVGTDPTQGEALGMTILSELTRRRSRVLATSHYANLKVWVHSQERMCNAAMLFDTKTLRPTYQFKLGLPGASYGLEIARRIGMDERYLKTAKSYVNSSNLKIDQLIAELERLKLETIEREESLQIEEDKLSKLVAEYTARLSEVKKEAKLIVKGAKEEALCILDDTRRLAEKLVKEIRERDKDAIKEVRQILAREMEILAEIPKASPEIKPSDTVYIKSLQSSGIVTEVVGRLARIDMGRFRVTVPISDLEK